MTTQYTKEVVQCSSRVLMIRPTGFGRDDEAAQTNTFMVESGDDAATVAQMAQQEFDSVVEALRDSGVDVLVFEDDLGLPDSIFPNNWVSFHQPVKGSAVLITYPMCAQARRRERRDEILDAIAGHLGIQPDHLDLGVMEENGQYLEGTGSMVLDRINAVAYACLSGRTSETALDAWSDETGYRIVSFGASDADANAVYHTNVILSIGSRSAVVCLEAIGDLEDREKVLGELRKTDRKIIEITLEQVGQFCGNLIELCSVDGQAVFAMSASCRDALNEQQLGVLAYLGTIVAIPIPTIERVSGGSVRCMIAELGSA
ncbi:MAG: hypothetical protein JKY96_06970 [Phycisphaerales bacterium]|nr:hypothetical protein [Phycisphaerales bacterium]